MKLIHYINDVIIGEYDNIKNLNKENNQKYQFYLDNISNNIYITDRLNFIRENEEYKFTIELGNKNECYIFLKDKKLKFNIEVLLGKYTFQKNKIVIEYKLETDNENHKIIIETGE